MQMNLKTWLPLGTAVVLGIGAAVVARDLVTQQPITQLKQGPALRAVVVAAVDVPAGTVLTKEQLTLAQVSDAAVPETGFNVVDTLNGRVTKVKLVTGQPVVEHLLTPLGTGGGLQALVPTGMRAVTVEVDEYSGLAGFLVPGCKVDLILTIRGSAEQNQTLTRTVVQNLQVAAVGQRIDPDAQDKEAREASAEEGIKVTRSVTLLTTPQQAESIELAATMGRPRLVLRGSGDNFANPLAGVTLDQLLGERSAKTPGLAAALVNGIVDSLKAKTPGFTLPTPSFVPMTTPVADATPAVPARAQVRRVEVIRAGQTSTVEMRETTRLAAPANSTGVIVTSVDTAELR